MSISNEKLRTFAIRAVRAIEDNRATHPMLSEFEPALIPLAARFNEAFDAYRNFTPTRAEKMASRHDRCAELYTLMRQWGGALTVAIPSYDANKLLGGPKDPDPLIAEARRLITLLADQGERLGNREALTDRLNELVTAATEERAVSLQTLKRHQALEAAVTPLNDELYRVVSLLRESLRIVLGVGHADYQALRIRAKPKKKDAQAKAAKKGKTKDEPKAEEKVETKVESKTETKDETKPETKVEAKSEPKDEAKVEPKEQPKDVAA